MTTNILVPVSQEHDSSDGTAKKQYFLLLTYYSIIK